MPKISKTCSFIKSKISIRYNILFTSIIIIHKFIDSNLWLILLTIWMAFVLLYLSHWLQIGHKILWFQIDSNFLSSTPKLILLHIKPILQPASSTRCRFRLTFLNLFFIIYELLIKLIKLVNTYNRDYYLDIINTLLISVNLYTNIHSFNCSILAYTIYIPNILFSNTKTNKIYLIAVFM